MTTTPRTSSRTGPPLLTTALLCLALVLGASGCTGQDEADRPSQDPSATDGAAPAPVRTRVDIGTVSGRLERQRRPALRKQVTAVVDGWIDAAYVAGPWPRTDLSRAFPGFTPGARAQARRDARLLTNVAYGRRIEGVTATRRSLRIDVLAVRGAPVGVTARVLLAFRTTGRRDGAEVVRGSLFLTREDRRWRVFAYDLARGERRSEGRDDRRGARKGERT